MHHRSILRYIQRQRPLESVRLDQVIRPQRLPVLLRRSTTTSGRVSSLRNNTGTTTFVRVRGKSLACSYHHPLLAHHSPAPEKALSGECEGAIVESGEVVLSREGLGGKSRPPARLDDKGRVCPARDSRTLGPLFCRTRLASTASPPATTKHFAVTLHNKTAHPALLA